MRARARFRNPEFSSAPPFSRERPPFQVQPLVAKSILPWFGGSAAVWAHWLSGRTAARQKIIHPILLALSLPALPVFGLPYFLLSSTSPLLQSWFSRSKAGATPLPPVRADSCWPGELSRAGHGWRSPISAPSRRASVSKRFSGIPNTRGWSLPTTRPSRHYTLGVGSVYGGN